jgi:hypothetical protein
MCEQAAQMFHAQPGGFLVESFVAEGDVPGSESFEQFADASSAEPGEDAFGALGSAERSEQFRCRRLRGLGFVDVQQRRKVVPE